MLLSKTVKLSGRVVVLNMKHSEINKELGLLSDYTDTVEDFMRLLGLPGSAAEKTPALNTVLQKGDGTG